MNTRWGLRYLLLASCLIWSTGCHSAPTTTSAPVVESPPAPLPQGLPVEKIVELSQQRTDPQIIINLMDSTRSTYVVTPELITYLKQQGVSDAVIIRMQSRAPGGGAPPSPQVVVPQAVVGPAYVAPAVVAPPVLVAPYGYWGYGYGRRW